MRLYPQPIADHISARKPMLVHVLIWLQARNRQTGAQEAVGFWTGADHQVISVGGSPREYHGVGALLDVGDLTSAADLMQTDWSFTVSPLHDQAVEALRLYDARLAPVECHLWYFDPVTNLSLADPVREFRGTVMEVDLPLPEDGGAAVATVQCVSDSWRLTRPLTAKKSQAALEAREPGDMFRQYNTVSGVVSVHWGEKVKEGS